jgi:hypothetical protein
MVPAIENEFTLLDASLVQRAACSSVQQQCKDDLEHVTADSNSVQKL